ncbi:MAG TPA: ABC transporter permease [Thermoplasmata archaeon]|nr:ABC transporter permease [Thermoplasmata archaeon]
MTGTRHRGRSLLTLAYMNGIVPMRTQPLYLVGVLASPLSFLFFVSVASQGRLLLAGVSGGMVLTMLSIGTSLQTDMSHYRQDLKLQDLVVASPVEAPIYVAGIALSELVYSIPGIVVLAALWVVNAPVTVLGVVTVIPLLLMVWAFASGLGFTLATFFADVRETFIFSTLVSLGLSVLPPVYYPVSYLPMAIRPLAYLSPTTYAADLMRHAFGLEALTLSAQAVDWGVLIAFTLALLAIAGWKARWREP